MSVVDREREIKLPVLIKLLYLEMWDQRTEISWTTQLSVVENVKSNSQSYECVFVDIIIVDSCGFRPDVSVVSPWPPLTYRKFSWTKPRQSSLRIVLLFSKGSPPEDNLFRVCPELAVAYGGSCVGPQTKTGDLAIVTDD